MRFQGFLKRAIPCSRELQKNTKNTKPSKGLFLESKYNIARRDTTKLTKHLSPLFPHGYIDDLSEQKNTKNTKKKPVGIKGLTPIALRQFSSMRIPILTNRRRKLPNR